MRVLRKQCLVSFQDKKRFNSNPKAEREFISQEERDTHLVDSPEEIVVPGLQPRINSSTRTLERIGV